MAVRCTAQILLPWAWVDSFFLIWLYVVWREYDCLWNGLQQLCHRMALGRLARVVLPLARVNASLLSYGCTPYGASILAFGLGSVIFAVVWLYIVWPEYHCLWPGSIHLCYHMAVCRLARVLLPLAWVTSYLLLHGCTSYGFCVYTAEQVDRTPLSKLCLGNLETNKNEYTHIASL